MEQLERRWMLHGNALRMTDGLSQGTMTDQGPNFGTVDVALNVRDQSPSHPAASAASGLQTGGRHGSHLDRPARPPAHIGAGRAVVDDRLGHVDPTGNTLSSPTPAQQPPPGPGFRLPIETTVKGALPRSAPDSSFQQPQSGNQGGLSTGFGLTSLGGPELKSDPTIGSSDAQPAISLLAGQAATSTDPPRPSRDGAQVFVSTIQRDSDDSLSAFATSSRVADPHRFVEEIENVDFAFPSRLIPLNDGRILGYELRPANSEDGEWLAESARLRNAMQELEQVLDAIARERASVSGLQTSEAGTLDQAFPPSPENQSSTPTQINQMKLVMPSIDLSATDHLMESNLRWNNADSDHWAYGVAYYRALGITDDVSAERIQFVPTQTAAPIAVDRVSTRRSGEIAEESGQLYEHLTYGLFSAAMSAAILLGWYTPRRRSTVKRTAMEFASTTDDRL